MEQQILFTRHLNEINDLRQFGRDAPVVNSLENHSKLTNISELIFDKIKKGARQSVMFITSPRIRAKQTAELIAGRLIEMGTPRLKLRFSVNENLKSTEQGRFILPDNYQPGDEFSVLKTASNIFEQHLHPFDYPDMTENIDYRFGDPIKLAEGKYKYPELAGWFLEFGESYRESLIRFYTIVVNASKKYRSLLRNTEVVIVAHGQVYHLFRGLSELGRLAKKSRIVLGKGESLRLLWEIYCSCGDDQKVPGICQPLEIDCLGNPMVQNLLLEEIRFLQNNQPLSL